MSCVTLPATSSVQALVEAFRTRDTFTGEERGMSLMLIDPVDYQGSYGGIVSTQALQAFDPLSFVAGNIGHACSVVWWHSPRAPFVGDLGFTEEGRVGVPLDVLARMSPHLLPVRGPTTAHSSYFGSKATLFMKCSSSAKSDSE